MANEFEITKVRLIIRQFLWETRKAVESAEAAQKWLIQFRNTLEYQELEENPDAYALTILAEARSFNNTKQRNQQMRWVRATLEKDGIKNPTQEQLDDKWLEMYGTNQETTADAPTRDGEENGSEVRQEPSTSANLSEAIAGMFPTSRKTRAGVDSVLLRGGSHSAPARNSGRKFRNKEEFMQWAIDNGLDASDASDCWEATEERGGKDKDGKAVKNMEAFAMQWCKTSAHNRRSA